MSRYAIIIERADDGGYGAWSPDVPGCVALGDTEAEALSEMKEAIRGHPLTTRAHALPPDYPSQRVIGGSGSDQRRCH